MEMPHSEMGLGSIQRDTQYGWAWDRRAVHDAPERGQASGSGGRYRVCHAWSHRTGDGKVFVLTTEAIECLTADSGRSVWRIKRPALPAGAVRKLGFAGMYEYRLTVMLYHDGVVLLAQPEPNTHHTYHTMPGTLYAFNAKDGRELWKHSYGGWGHCTPPDVFVVGDLVWTHVNAETEFGRVWGNGFRAKDPSKVDYRIQALDLRTGKLAKELSTKDVFNVAPHGAWQGCCIRCGSLPLSQPRDSLQARRQGLSAQVHSTKDPRQPFQRREGHGKTPPP